MKFLQSSLESLATDSEIKSGFIKVNESLVSFKIQDGPIKEVGLNGCQVTDMLKFSLEVYKGLQADFPCRENAITITKLEEAIMWQAKEPKIE